MPLHNVSTSHSWSIRDLEPIFERIGIHGNTRTSDFVIRREFDIAEGDAYNKTLIDRAERRLKESATTSSPVKNSEAIDPSL